MDFYTTVILFLIAIPSFALLYSYDESLENPSFTIKCIGHQWYWSYELTDFIGGFSFIDDSYTLSDTDLSFGEHRLLETDKVLLLPVQIPIRIVVTSEDVLHSWAVPALGVKIDAIPGRLNSAFFTITSPGTYWGMCSELCGVNHSNMSILVEGLRYISERSLGTEGIMASPETRYKFDACVADGVCSLDLFIPHKVNMYRLETLNLFSFIALDLMKFKNEMLWYEINHPGSSEITYKEVESVIVNFANYEFPDTAGIPEHKMASFNRFITIEMGRYSDYKTCYEKLSGKVYDDPKIANAELQGLWAQLQRQRLKEGSEVLHFFEIYLKKETYKE